MSSAYARAGIDLTRVAKIHEGLAQLLGRRLGGLLSGIGHYAALLDLGCEGILALHADGVGTKVLIAQMMERYDTIGIDCVAMCANDLLCVGARPVALIDYLALERADEGLVKSIVEGLTKGARMAGMSVVGGETAIMPDVIKGIGGRGFDLAAMALGVVKRDGVLLGKAIEEGDAIVGLRSSGIHSNGLSLARKVLLKRFSVKDRIPALGRTLGEELLEPTRIYVKPVLRILNRYEVHGIAHITGGGFTKLMRLGRLAKKGFLLDALPDPPPIFQLIRRLGRISKVEMYRVFNMGIGLCIIAPSSEVEGMLRLLSREGMEGEVIGKVIRRRGVFVGDPKFRIDDGAAS